MNTAWITIVLAIGAVALSLTLVICGFLLTEPQTGQLIDLTINWSEGLKISKGIPGILFMLGGVGIMLYAFNRLVKKSP